eukprot:CAMPEP_0194124292 /NCGR_PEP_ID=MMETSP0150-20130528/58028_1 /TAXON_ID=122233 /ORGANISM="Chaetoceros debilis, Strain MM31A-1" /LENGTH=390 /DNA_ID=CAMNT_0038817951 /DNA_START=361 /DNA_END=1533 /DNA_ORIENTATION=-
MAEESENDTSSLGLKLIEGNDEYNKLPDRSLLWAGEEVVQYEPSSYNKQVRTVEVVIAYCKANLNWMKENENVLKAMSMNNTAMVKMNIISKCGREKEIPTFTTDDGISELNIISVPNAGGCDYAYAHFINQYIKNHITEEAASSVIIFIKDTPRDYDYFRMAYHERYRSIEEILNIAGKGEFICGSKTDCNISPYHSTDIINRFTMKAYVRQTERNNGKKVRKRNNFNYHDFKNLEDFHKRGLEWTFPNANLTSVCYGGTFALPASRLVALSRRPVEGRVFKSLEAILGRQSNGATTIEEHFIERTWAGLLSHPLNKNQTDIIHEISNHAGSVRIKSSVFGSMRSKFGSKKSGDVCKKWQIKKLQQKKEENVRKAIRAEENAARKWMVE